MYTEECIQTFLEKQEQLFDEPVAETYEEAEEFLEDCMAVVADSIDEVRKYLSGMGADVDGMSNEELEEASEVFALPVWESKEQCNDECGKHFKKVCINSHPDNNLKYQVIKNRTKYNA